MLISATFNVWFVVAPLLLLQYGVAVFCLTRLAYCKLSVRAYVLWNLFILLVFFVGSIVFLVYYYTHRDKLRLTREELEGKPEAIVIDAPVIDAPEVANGDAQTAESESGAPDPEKKGSSQTEEPR